MLVLSLILVGIILRFLPHAPNFTPVAAIAIFAGAYMDKRRAIIVPLALMMISDLFLGLHDVVLFTWGSFALCSLIGMSLKASSRARAVLLGSMASSLIFYLITNLGVWLVGWYPNTPAGLLSCYINGLPFLRNFTAATFLYTTVLFLAYALTAKAVKDSRFAKVLLRS